MQAKEFTTPEKIAEEIRDAIQRQGGRYTSLTDEKIEHVAQRMSKDAPRIFATLTYLRKSLKVFDLPDRMTDADLPLNITCHDKLWKETKYPDEELWKNEEGEMDEESGELMEQFGAHQWWMMAPVFEKGKHHSFHHRIILPYLSTSHANKIYTGNQISNSESPESKASEHGHGGFSEVTFKQIHPSHHNFWPAPVSGKLCDKPWVAIKKLKQSNDPQFKNEAEILWRLASHHHPHIITLLATMAYGDKCCFIFPKADYNPANSGNSYPRHIHSLRTYCYGCYAKCAA